MYSNSNSLLGGANTTRPGANPSPFNPQSQYGQQQNGFQPQQTGYGGSLRPQQTGYSGQQAPLQQQYTGYPQQNAHQFQQSQPPMPPMPTGYSQQNLQQYQQPQQNLVPQPTGFQPMQPPQQQIPSPAPQQQPQPTGMTSAQMAASFRGTASPAQTTSGSKPPASRKIPNQRISFITAKDQAGFEQLFKSATGNDQAISGDKARDLLIRSKLPGDALSQIWTLSDTTKSGQLHFPEFALAMYLCNLKLTGKDLPSTLPERIKNEVSSMVDIISFGVVEDGPQRPAPAINAPFFDQPMQSSYASQPVQQPQPQQPSNSQLLSQLVSQPTGFQQPQPFQPQPTGFVPQQTGYQQPQQTGFQQPQQNGYQGPRPPMPPMPTGFGGPAAAPLNAQPTGRPGQWGLVNAPSSGLPNLEAMQQQMMPQQGREGGYTTTGLSGNAKVPWAVTKDEKKMYDNMFRAWDGFGKGYITGPQAIEIFNQSGLAKPDLERIWTLADSNNKGRLDLDEFAVAMHIIYRKLNGYPVPNRLPPELVPPSTRNFNDSVGSIKSLLSRDAEERKNSADFLNPHRTGVSYAKNHSFAGTNGFASSTRKDATVFKNDDNDVGYRSSARRRVGDGGRSPSPASTATPPNESADELSLDDLQKRIREKQVLLDAIDFKDEGQADQDDMLDRKDRRDGEDLLRRIRRMQEDIDGHPSAGLRGGNSGAERRTMRRQLQALTDRLPDIASQVRKAEKSISDARLELFRLKDAKAYPNAASAIVGTGPGGSVTESDRVKARAKAMMQQRSAALTGMPIQASDDSDAATKRFEQESSKVSLEKDNNDRMVHDVEDSVNTYSRGVEDSLKEGAEDTSTEHERRRWEDGLGVEDEVKDFIFDLQRSSRSAEVRREDAQRDTRSSNVRSPAPSSSSTIPRTESPAAQPETAAKASASTSSYSSYKTREDRAAFIKQQAEQRMAERLAALGLRAPSKPAESGQQRQERERKEADERRRQAEAEDSKREEERQKRLADEQITPPIAAKSVGKAPPPPPSRGKRSDSLQKKAEVEAQQQALKQQQEAAAVEAKNVENGEDALRKEREASEARTKALQEQVRQGKLKKEEERKQRKAAQKETLEKEQRLAAQRAELEAARERERELQRQLESMGDDSSTDDEGPEQLTPQDATPVASQELLPASTARSPEPQTMASVTSSQAPSIAAGATPPTPSSPEAPYSPPTISSPAISIPPAPPADSKNPYHKLTSPPSTTATETNPFHRLSMHQTQAPAAPLIAQRTSSRFDAPTTTTEDDWSIVDSRSQESDEDESDGPSAGSAKHLASILFGTMAPPKPLSRNVTGASPAPSTSIFSPPPPPVPAMPGTFDAAEPAAAPPPPPPPPSMAAPAPPMPPSAPPMPMGAAGDPPAPPPPPPPPAVARGGGMSALLGDIQMGKGLKKTATKDRSTASTAGRVL